MSYKPYITNIKNLYLYAHNHMFTRIFILSDNIYLFNKKMIFHIIVPN